jgi:Zn-dependent protease
LNIENVLMIIFTFVIAITLHEFGHAYVADLFGDDGPRRAGRISLNPIDHLDPVGTIVLVISSFSGSMFGWGKPVMVDVTRFKNPRFADICVTAAGPLMNLFLACVCAILMRTNALNLSAGSTGGDLLRVGVELNAILFLFNLLPVPPLDGSHILANLLPDQIAVSYRQFMAQFGFICLIAVMFGGWYLIAGPFTILREFLIG